MISKYKKAAFLSLQRSKIFKRSGKTTKVIHTDNTRTGNIDKV